MGTEAEAQLEAFSDWLRGEDEEEAGFRSRAVTERDLLVGSCFALTGGTEQDGFGALWGRAAVSRFDGREGDLSLDGEVTSAMVGADWTRERSTAGLMVSHSRGEGGYRSPRSRGEVESTLTGVYPYPSGPRRAQTVVVAAPGRPYHSSHHEGGRIMTSKRRSEPAVSIPRRSTSRGIVKRGCEDSQATERATDTLEHAVHCTRTLPGR